MQPAKTNPTSILNPELEITETNWALSYCVKGHVTKEEPEHVFLIIQTNEELFKREVCYDGVRDKRGERGFAIVKSKDTAYTSGTLDKYFNKIVWEDERGELHVDKTLAITSNVRHKTWLVDSAKIQGLLEDIAKDAKNPPRFLIHGNASMMERGEFEERRIKAEISGMLFVDMMNKYSIATDSLLGYGFLVTYIMANAFLSNEVGKMWPCLTPATHGKHNCATWAKEKLTALEIPEIDKDLKSLWTDNIIFVPSFRVPITPRDIPAISGALAEGAKNKASGSEGVTICGRRIS